MTDTRREHAERLQKEGKSLAEIGVLMGISKQRVHQLLTGYKSPAHRRSKQNKAARGNPQVGISRDLTAQTQAVE